MFYQEAPQLILDHFFLISLIVSLAMGGFGPAQVSFDQKSNKFFLFWINFVGASVGCLALYVFIHFVSITGGADLLIGHILLLLIGILGIVGLLPNTLVGIVNSTSKLVDRLVSGK